MNSKIHQSFLSNLWTMDSKTAKLNALVKSLGLLAIVESSKTFIPIEAPVPEESLTSSAIRQDLKDAVEEWSGEETGY